MSEKKQFFKEEVTAYSDIFQTMKIVIQKTGKEGASMTAAADFLKDKTTIPWRDQFKILLKTYGQ